MFYGKFPKRRKNENKILVAHILAIAWAIFFKFGMWAPLPDGHLCSKIDSNRMRMHKAIHGIPREVPGLQETPLDFTHYLKH